MAYDRNEEDENLTPVEDTATEDAAAPEAAVDTAPKGPPSVKEYIAKKYGLKSSSDDYNKLAADRTAIDNARTAAEDRKGSLSRIQGITQMFGGHKSGDDAFYNGLRGDADKKVARLEGDKQQQLSNYLASNKLDDDDLSRQKTMTDMDEAARQRDISVKQDNPKSPESEALRSFIKQVAPGLAATPGFENASYSQLSKGYTPYVQAYEAAEARKEAARSRNQTASENAADRKAHQQDKLDQQDKMDLRTAQDKMNSETKSIRDQLDVAGRLDDEIKAAQTNPEARNILPISLARSAVGGGRINQQEIDSLGGSKAILEHAEQIAKEWSDGTLTPANYKYMSDLAALTKKSAQAALQDRTTHHAKQYSQRSGKSLDSAYADITGGDALPAPAAPAAAFPRQVTNPKTGAKATVTNEADLKEAQGEGFQ